MRKCKIVLMLVMLSFLLSGCAAGKSNSAHNQAYRGVKYGMGKDKIESIEKNYDSYKQDFQLTDSLSYYIEMSDNYADLTYTFNNGAVTEIHIFSCLPYWGFDIPQHIWKQYIKPDDLYDMMFSELTALYGKPRIEADKVIWENKYETIEGSIENWTRESGAIFGGRIVDENGKEENSVSGRRSDFRFYLKES